MKEKNQFRNQIYRSIFDKRINNFYKESYIQLYINKQNLLKEKKSDALLHILEI